MQQSSSQDQTRKGDEELQLPTCSQQGIDEDRDSPNSNKHRVNNVRVAIRQVVLANQRGQKHLRRKYLGKQKRVRMQGTLGANPLLFAKILSSQVFLAALIGKNNLPYRHSYIIYAVLITIGGIAVLVYALLRARWELKLFITFASLVLAAALLHPMAHAPQWLELLSAWGVRYWLLPMLAFVSVLALMAGNNNPRSVRVLALVGLLLMSIGMVREWRYPGFADLQFRVYARQLSDLPEGSSLTIPLNPQGWSMTLTKR